MSRPLETRSIAYTGNGATVFAVPFPFARDADIDATLLLVDETVPTTQVQGVHYTLTGANNPNDGEGGELTMLVAPPAGSTLTISRTVPFTQDTNFRTSGPFSPALHMAALDKLTDLCQQLRDRLEAIEVDGIAELGTLDVVVVEKNFTTDADAVENGFPITVALPTGYVPTVVLKAKCVNEDDGAALFQESVTVENWSVAADTLTIGYVTGLAPGVEYTLRLFLLAIEVT